MAPLFAIVLWVKQPALFFDSQCEQHYTVALNSAFSAIGLTVVTPSEC